MLENKSKSSSSDLSTPSKKIVSAMDSSKENFTSPVLQISGGSNITINLHILLITCLYNTADECHCKVPK